MKLDKFLRLRILVPIEIIILFAISAIVVHKNNLKTPWNLSANELQSFTMTYDEKTGYWEYSGKKNDDSSESSEDRGVLNGPDKLLPKGTYTVIVEYETDTDQEFSPFTVDNEEYLVGNNISLPADRNSIEYNFEAKQDISDFEFRITYAYASSHFVVKNIYVYENALGYFRLLVSLLFLFAVIDLFIKYYTWICSNKKYVVGIIAGWIVSSLPLFVNGAFYGMDFGVQINRIEGLYFELKNGVFPVYLESMFFNGKGYPISIYYNSLLLYFPAVLRLAGFTIADSYDLYIHAVNIGTAIISFYCFNKILKNKDLSMLASFAYTTAIYRLTCVYIRAAVGECSAMMFLPFIAVAFWRMYVEKKDDSLREYVFRTAPYLTIGLSGLVATHILTLEITCVILAIIGLAFIKRTFTKYNIAVLLASGCITLLCNLYFLVPFADYLVNVQTNIRSIVGHGIKKIQYVGVDLASLLTLTKASRGKGTIDFSAGAPSPGIVFVFIMIFSVYLWKKKKLSKDTCGLTVISMIVLFTASKYFPWDFLSFHSRAFNCLAQIQFPYRLLLVVSILCSMLIAFIVRDINPQNTFKICEGIEFNSTITILFTAMFLSAVILEGDFISTSEVYSYNDTRDINTDDVGNGEYLLTDSYPPDVPNELVTEKGTGTAEYVWERGTDMEIHCVSKSDDYVVSVPKMNYKGYHVYDSQGDELEILLNGNQTVSFAVPYGYDGDILIRYETPIIWNIAWMVSAITLLCCIVAQCLSLKSGKKR